MLERESHLTWEVASIKLEPCGPVVRTLAITNDTLGSLVGKVRSLNSGGRGCKNLWDFPGGSDTLESAFGAGDPGSIPGLGRSLGEKSGHPLQYSCLENPQGQRSLVGYSPWGHKESDTTERLTLHFRLVKEQWQDWREEGISPLTSA